MPPLTRWLGGGHEVYAVSPTDLGHLREILRQRPYLVVHIFEEL